MKNTKKGFTLIELLVVIAIIGILSAVVLASLSSARNKANDAKVQGQLTSIRSAAEIYYGNNGGSYSGLCGVTSTDTTGLYTLLQGSSYPGGTAPTCVTNGTAWAVSRILPSTTNVYFCVDSNGKAATTTANVTTAAYACS